MKITPDLVPHEDFHTGSWLQSVPRPSWYYFHKKVNRNTISDPGFNDSLDEPLKPLVKLLHRKGIKTTPSCAGHALSDRNLEKIYDLLEADEKDISGRGLKLQDVETGRQFTYKDAGYRLPWSRSEFVSRVEAYQHRGVLGIRPGHNRRLAEQLLRLEIKGVRIEKKGSIIFIFTNEDRQTEINATWEKITNRVRQILR